MMLNPVSCLIPFSGFYYSTHDREFDHALEMMFDPEGIGAAYAGPLAMRFFDTINWTAAQTAYAGHYVSAFATKLGLSAVQFEEMTSPREYNFSTDRLFAKVEFGELAAMLARPDIHARLDVVARDWFTSRSGFISHYSPDVTEWGELAEWDYNQRGALLRAAADVIISDGGQYGQDAESDLMESTRCNGRIDDWMWNNTTDNAVMGNRCDKVARYLAQREQRG